MAQVTIYTDDELLAAMKAAAATEGKSLSRWICELVRERAEDAWPEEVLRLAGADPDFPLSEELRADQPEDAPRELL